MENMQNSLFENYDDPLSVCFITPKRHMGYQSFIYISKQFKLFMFAISKICPRERLQKNEASAGLGVDY